MYNLEQLKAFTAVCESGSISAAARKLGKAQSGVSSAVANLEIALNQTLFKRSKNAVQLTESGKALLPMVQALLQQMRFFEQKVEALNQHEEDTLIIAFDEILWNDKLIALFTELQRTFPHTKVDLQVQTATSINAMIERGEIDLGITYQKQPQPHLRQQILGRQHFMAAVADTHPLAALAQVTFADLARHCQLIHTDTQSAVLSPQHWYINSHYLMMELVNAGMGWAVLPEHLLKEDNFGIELARLNVTQELSPHPLPITVLRSFNHSTGRVTEFFLARLKEVIAI